jgi:hypothetical protein
MRCWRGSTTTRTSRTARGTPRARATTASALPRRPSRAGGAGERRPAGRGHDVDRRGVPAHAARRERHDQHGDRLRGPGADALPVAAAPRGAAGARSEARAARAARADRRRDDRQGHEPARAVSAEPEAERLLEACPAPLLFPVACGLFAGLRVDEMLHLRPAFDVDLSLGLLIIQPQHDADRKPTWTPKTKKRREVPIAPDLRPFLEQHLDRFASEDWMMPSLMDPARPCPGPHVHRALQAGRRRRGARVRPEAEERRRLSHAPAHLRELAHHARGRPLHGRQAARQLARDGRGDVCPPRARLPAAGRRSAGRRGPTPVDRRCRAERISATGNATDERQFYRFRGKWEIIDIISAK